MISFLVFFVAASAQEQKKNILVIPLSQKNIHLSKKVGRILKNNHVPPDSLVQYIAHAAREEIKNIFQNYTLQFQDDDTAQFLPDSLYSLKKFNCFYLDIADSSFRNNYEKSWAKDSYHNLYYGIELTGFGKEAVNIAILNSQCDYVLFINQFEIQANTPYFSLSCEIADKTLRKIYGNKNEWEAHLLHNLYYDVLKYYSKKSIREMLLKAEEYLKTIK